MKSKYFFLFLFIGLSGCASYQASTQNETGAGTELQITSSGAGSILSDQDGMTAYTFAADPPGNSTCINACSAIWPPLTVPAGTEPVAGTGVNGKIGLITRADGTIQVTYNGKALYLYSGDAAPGDTNGNDLYSFGNYWYVVMCQETSC